jgi:hypothetical protein
MSSDDLHAHLQAQASEGTLVDTGSITLNAVKAREKLSKFSFPEPGLWVVKLVQAAVACGASEIRFEFHRQKVKVRFGNAAGWQADQIMALLTSGQFSSDRALMHLQAGLSAATCAENEALAWSCGGKTVRLLPDSTEVEEDDNTDHVHITAFRVHRRMSLTERFTSPIRHQFHQTAHEYKALVDRAVFSPVPVFLDNYDLPRRYARNYTELPKIKGYDSEKGDGLGKVFAVRALHDVPDRKELRYPIVERDWLSGPGPGETDKKFETQWWKPEDRPAQAVMSLIHCQQRESEVLYVLDGALLQYEQLFIMDATDFSRRLSSILEADEEQFLLSIVVEVKPDDVDLSHFQARVQKLGPVLLHAVPALIEMLESLRNWCELNWSFSPLPKVQARLKDYSVADIALVGLGVAIIPVVLGLCGVILVLSPLAYIFDGSKSRAEKFRSTIGPVLNGLRALDRERADYF